MAEKYPHFQVSEVNTDSDDSENSYVSVEPEEVAELVYVRGDDGSYRGWKTELLTEQITSKVEAKFLLCSYCSGVLRDACLFEKDGRQELRCSVCIPNEDKQIAQMNRETVNEKQVNCPLKAKGCGWTKELSEVLHHLEECELFPVACPLGCRDERGEVSRVERRGVETHRTFCPMRTVKCEYCGSNVKSCEVNIHLEGCEEFPIPCPNKCEETLWGRKDMCVHLSQQCPLEEICCPYSQHGCEVRVQRKTMDQHEKEEIHVHFKLAMLTIGELRNEVSELRQENNDFKATLISTGELEWRIDDLENKLMEEIRTYSEPFNMGLYKLQSSFKWNLQDELAGIRLYIYIMRGKWDNNLMWPLRYKCTIELINQLNDENNYVKYKEVTKESLERFPDCFKKPTTALNSGFGFKFISYAELFEDKYSAGDAITIRIRVEQLPAW